MSSKPSREKFCGILEIIALSLGCGFLAGCLFLMLAFIAFAMGA